MGGKGGCKRRLEAAAISDNLLDGPQHSIFSYYVSSTRAVIGQLSGPYSPARTAKLLRDLYRQIFTTYIANKSLKLSCTLNCVLKRANDLK